MDNSERYIKQCKKAKKIQENWRPAVGDWVWRGEEYLMIPEACAIITDINFQKKEEIWLLQQNQSQNMIKLRNWGLTYENGHWLTWKLASRNKIMEAESPEQALFKRVMCENYLKIWDDEKEDWVNA